MYTHLTLQCRMQASERRRRPLTTDRPSCSASGRPRLFEHGTVDDGDGWCNGAQRGQGVELAIKRSLVRFPARARLPDYSGQVVHTHGPRRTESSLLHGVVHRMPLHLGRVGGQVPQIPSKVQRRSPCPDGDRGKPPENGAFAARPQKLKTVTFIPSRSLWYTFSKTWSCLRSTGCLLSQRSRGGR